ncbi:hypothetical protein CW731_04085 [Polaribacter sp. ALD11]|uniref:hypothetical protein n=1 Tax=Polaribacter sp. ALD11 TaxID=2058137 RepID=UPI000C30DD6A|nr:hypothetical protein [Polaribacter sp. ALD11]AUC84528.1 hypothetical protein CW731_04085 [Polaribacter sp. ALD11]
MFISKTKYCFLLFSLLFATVGNAQKVYLETGFESAYFKDYVNNLGEDSLDVKYSKTPQLFLEGGFLFDLYKERLKWDLGVSYNSYKINTGFFAGKVSIPLTYDLAYVALKAGLNYAFVNQPTFKLQVHMHLSYDLLTSGSSKYKNVVNNLLTDNTLDRSLIRYHRGLSGTYIISDNLSIYLNYNVADSFKEKNKDSNAEEKYSLHTNAVSFGLLFNLQPLRH